MASVAGDGFGPTDGELLSCPPGFRPTLNAAAATPLYREALQAAFRRVIHANRGLAALPKTLCVGRTGFCE